MARLVPVNSDDGGDASGQPEVSDRSTDSPAMRSITGLAGSPALRAAAEAAVTWQRYQALGAGITSEAASAIRSVVGQIRPGIAKITNAVGQALVQMYRASAPPNWIIDES